MAVLWMRSGLVPLVLLSIQPQQTEHLVRYVRHLVSQQISIAKPRYRLSFKSGGSTVFSVNSRQPGKSEAAKPNATAATPEDSVTIGISGLLSTGRTEFGCGSVAFSAFSDLDALMRSAWEMVQLASKISEKLACTSGDLSSKERNTFNDLVESSEWKYTKLLLNRNHKPPFTIRSQRTSQPSCKQWSPKQAQEYTA